MKVAQKKNPDPTRGPGLLEASLPRERIENVERRRECRLARERCIRHHRVERRDQAANTTGGWRRDILHAQLSVIVEEAHHTSRIADGELSTGGAIDRGAERIARVQLLRDECTKSGLGSLGSDQFHLRRKASIEASCERDVVLIRVDERCRVARSGDLDTLRSNIADSAGCARGIVNLLAARGERAEVWSRCAQRR